MCAVLLKKNKDRPNEEEQNLRENDAYLYEEIRWLVDNMYMLSKEQIWAYFGDMSEKDAISRVINKMVQDKVLFPVDDINQTRRAKIRYVTDSRYLSEEYFKLPSIKGEEDHYGNLENYKKHKKNMENHMTAFWVFLDFKRKYKAEYPISINARDYPCMVMVFTIKEKQWEILRVPEGDELQLQVLATKDKYSNDKNPNERIVILDSTRQIEKVSRYGIQYIKLFAVMDNEGNTKYIVNMD